MFKEIYDEFLSIVDNDAISKISNTVTVPVARTLEMVFNIKFDDIVKVHQFEENNCVRTVVIYRDNDPEAGNNACMIEGKLHFLFFIPESAIQQSPDNIMNFCKTVFRYILFRQVYLENCNNYKFTLETVFGNILYIYSIPVIANEIMRHFFSGEKLPEILYSTLCELLPHYNESFEEEGFRSLSKLLDEGIGIKELLDDSMIFAVTKDRQYPGICWEYEEEEETT